MKFCFAYDSAYPWFNGGIEKRRYLIMQELARAGNEVHCFTMFREGMPGRRFRHKGVNYHCVANATPAGEMYKEGRRNMAWPLKYAALLPLEIADYKFDLIDADAFPFLHIPRLAIYAKISGAKFVVTWHEVWDKKYWYKYLEGLGIFGYAMEKLSASLSSNIIVNTSQTRHALAKVFGMRKKKIRVLPAAISRREMVAFAKRHPRKAGGNFVVVGRLVPEKRVEMAITAVAATKLGLTVIGSGPERQRLEALARRLDASERIHFVEGMEEEALMMEVRNARALLMFSEREGMSIISIEALALGTPVIITHDTSIPAEIKKYCHAINPRSAGGELERLVKSKNSILYKKSSHTEKVLREFSVEGAAKIYEEIAKRGK
ncbi:MAG: glycosyltransferase [Candidatus Micrarchaeota archaeon]|nr:glycosyltransferase [Candidatus Micrarchaeota archaeon]